jgi:hypothetical protein
VMLWVMVQEVLAETLTGVGGLVGHDFFVHNWSLSSRLRQKGFPETCSQLSEFSEVSSARCIYVCGGKAMLVL